MKPSITIMVLAVLAGCQQRTGQNSSAATKQPAGALVAAANEEHANQLGASKASVADDRTPLEEPKGPIDPHSVEAAGQAVQRYGALIEQKRWSGAGSIWGDPAQAALFQQELKRDREVHVEIGKLGEPEGAAGSIYVTMPITFYGRDSAGTEFRRPAEVILRRVNDVPGSTAAQRRWHIERIELK